MEPSLAEPIRGALDVWLGHHDRVAPGLIEGLYLVGSVALGDWRPGSDLDIVAFTADPPTDGDAELLRAAHDATIDEIDVPVDGPRLAWGDVSVPPQPIHRPWSLDGVFHHDGECFEINPVTWYTLARYGVAVRGEPVALLGVAADVDDRREFVRANVATYWRSVGEQLAVALDDPTREVFDAEVVAWCGLGIARMLYTSRTGDVASKTGAGEWAAAELPGHAEVLRTAIDIRHAVGPSAVGRRTVQQVHALVADVDRLVTG